jgi:hypothetical protein
LLSNDSPPYAAICGVNARRVAPLDKNPGVWLVHVGEAYMRLWGKTLVKMAGASAKAECGNKNSCAGLEAGVEGNLHAVREMWPDAGGRKS